MDHDRKPRRQVVAHMTKLLKALGQNAQGMEDDYAVNRRHIEKFREDRWGSTSREELQILMSLGDQCGVDFLTLETDEVWKTFDAMAASFLSRDAKGIRHEDTEAMQCLLKEGIHLDQPEGGDVVAKMKEKNCVIIGSPKYNEPCRIALDELFRSGESQDASDIPFRFRWSDLSADHPENRFYARSSASGEIGVELLVEDGGEQPKRRPKGTANQGKLSLGERRSAFLKADLPKATAHAYGWDYGIFVMCRKPSQTKANVTTVMLCGLSGFATKEMARELSQGLLFLHPAHVKDGIPLWRIFCCPWKREGRSVRAHSRGRGWINAADSEAIKKAGSDSLRPPPGRVSEPEDEDDYAR